MISTRGSFNRILLLPMCGFGDAVCFLPFLAAVRGRFPEARIVCMVISEQARAVIEGSGRDIEVIVFNRGGQQRGWRSLLRVIRRVRREKFDVVVSGAHPDSPRVPVFAALSGARVRVGARRERYSFLYNRRLDIQTDGHAYDRFRLLLQGLGIAMAPEEYLPAVQPDASAHDDAMQIWSDAGLDEAAMVIGLASGADSNARGRWKPYLKRWKPEKYAELVRWITEEAGGRVAMFGGPDERMLAEEISRAAGVPLANFCGKTGIHELPWLLQRCKALVTNDTGVMHMAAAVGTPIVALFGPSSPAGFAPRGAQHFVVQGNIPCSPCYPHPTCDLKECGAMDKISPEQVRASLATLISRSR